MRVGGALQKVLFAFSFLVLLEKTRTRGQSKVSFSGLKINITYPSVKISDAV